MEEPLSETTFWILTALAGERRHGYGIMQQIEASGNGSTLKVTTLYAALERLDRAGLVKPDGEEIVKGRSRRYFRLTDAGALALVREVARLEARARVAGERLAAARLGPAFRPAGQATA
ncbi:PadR family transcriptional regulator [Paeniglutamicibacter cryotolerans]|uniref:DNA-binding PadR family transcriptional regulator n=1 Tax=Paeniglutamicibacter cryotolerans TaxID=670079 RepID=A0A839QHR6_9MICC|nr:PadR family transcriptional regulator [Paeniglutamicibacter cryotolerans]MBB2995918.1 DNA-binding PadR family transcriptional regulator [Paeniglutamicibacter cryotolerans]